MEFELRRECGLDVIYVLMLARRNKNPAQAGLALRSNENKCICLGLSSRNGHTPTHERKGTQQGFKIGAVQHDVIYVLFAAT